MDLLHLICIIYKCELVSIEFEHRDWAIKEKKMMCFL